MNHSYTLTSINLKNNVKKNKLQKNIYSMILFYE